jgi:hypothetical protein
MESDPIVIPLRFELKTHSLEGPTSWDERAQ